MRVVILSSCPELGLQISVAKMKCTELRSALSLHLSLTSTGVAQELKIFAYHSNVNCLGKVAQCLKLRPETSGMAQLFSVPIKLQIVW